MFHPLVAVIQPGRSGGGSRWAPPLPFALILLACGLCWGVVIAATTLALRWLP